MYSRFRSTDVPAYNTGMQFRVPQNIAMEDRIIGPLTAIQFAILVLGGMGSFLVFTSTTIPAPINQFTGGIGIFLTIILALGKFNGQPMYKFARYIVSFIVSPKIRVWHKGGVETPLIKPSQKKDAGDHRATRKSISKSQIAGLAAVVDSRGQYGVVPTQPSQEDQRR